MSEDPRWGETAAVHLRSGLLKQARYVPSPNCDDRPPGSVPELIIVHGISLPPGCFGGPWIEQFFTNQLDTAADPYFATIGGLRVSAHLLIRRDGGYVQFVPFHRRAWHAGVSRWRERTACNDFSIGIELEGSDERAYTSAQYDALVAVCADLFAAYPGLSPAAIVGHCDVSPGRKTDPGPAFDWSRFRDLLAHAMRTRGSAIVK